MNSKPRKIVEFILKCSGVGGEERMPRSLWRMKCTDAADTACPMTAPRPVAERGPCTGACVMPALWGFLAVEWWTAKPRLSSEKPVRQSDLSPNFNTQSLVGQVTFLAAVEYASTTCPAQSSSLDAPTPWTTSSRWSCYPSCRKSRRSCRTIWALARRRWPSS